MRAAALLGLAGGIAALENYCGGSPQSSWPVCNPNLPLDARSADIVSRISLVDKVQLLSGGQYPKAAHDGSGIGAPSIGLGPYNWWSEATHGLLFVNYTAELSGASNTALPITTSCSFNRSLWTATGNQIGREGRAFMNSNLADSTFWTPVINIVRDPRWGRNIESAGEDPFLSGQYAVNFVTGFEHAKEAPCPLQASACCKHFVANELEATNGTDRYHVDVAVPQQDLVDSYLPSFQACVEEGKVSGIMCSYNAVNGVPSCANDWLLGTLLRESWQFDGYVTSDCDADSDVFNSHHYTASAEEAVQSILRAGTDVDCGNFMRTNTQSALDKGLVSAADLDTVLQRLFRVRLRLGHFDPPGVLQSIGPDQVCTPAALELARDGVRQSAVLVKNTGGYLPLSAAAISSAIVIGPNMAITDTFTYYGGVACNNSRASAIDAIAQHIPGATGLLGVPDVASADQSGIPAAAAAAAAADLVVLAIGSDLLLERESHDRTEISFSAAQLALIEAVAAASKNPVVALVFYGGAVDVTPLLSNPRVASVLMLGQPSVQVVGVGDVVFGRTLDGRAVAPAARMSQMVYPADYVNQVSMFEFGMRPGPSAWPPGTSPGRTYRFYTGTPVLPFGYGLSYTTWNYTVLPDPAPPAAGGAAAAATISLAGVQAAALAHAATGPIGHIPSGLQQVAAHFWVNVTNTGAVDSDDVVLGFLEPPGAGLGGVPLQELFGFERVFVPAGQTVTVYLGAQGVRFTQADVQGVRHALPGQYRVRFGLRESAALGMGFAEHTVVAV